MTTEPGREYHENEFDLNSPSILALLSQMENISTALSFQIELPVFLLPHPALTFTLVLLIDIYISFLYQSFDGKPTNNLSRSKAIFRAITELIDMFN